MADSQGKGIGKTLYQKLLGKEYRDKILKKENTKVREFQMSHHLNAILVVREVLFCIVY